MIAIMIASIVVMRRKKRIATLKIAKMLEKNMPNLTYHFFKLATSTRFVMLNWLVENYRIINL